MIKLANKAPSGFQQNSYDIYATWTIFASFLNNYIVKVHLNNQLDNSLNDIKSLIQKLENGDKQLRWFQQWTINWTKRGIIQS